LSSPILRACPVTLHIAQEDAAWIRPRSDPTLHRIRHRGYCRASEWPALQPWEGYLVRVHAVAAIRPDAVFSHESAAALLGLPLFGEPRDIHLFDLDAPKTHRVGDVVRHTSQLQPEVRRLD